MVLEFLSSVRSALGWLTSEMPGQTLSIVLTVILVPAVQGIYARYRYKGSRTSLLGMMDKHFDLLRRGVRERSPHMIAEEAAILDELMRTVAATMRPEMIRRYDDYLRGLIRNQGKARDLKYLSARLREASDDDREEEKGEALDAIRALFHSWQNHFPEFREHFL